MDEAFKLKHRSAPHVTMTGPLPCSNTRQPVKMTYLRMLLMAFLLHDSPAWVMSWSTFVLSTCCHFLRFNSLNIQSTQLACSGMMHVCHAYAGTSKQSTLIRNSKTQGDTMCELHTEKC